MSIACAYAEGEDDEDEDVYVSEQTMKEIEELDAIDEDEVTIELNDGTKPAMIKCSIPFLYVMMPLRVS